MSRLQIEKLWYIIKCMKVKFSSTFFFIYTAVFINILAFTLVFPLLPIYAKEFNASNFTIGLLAASFALSQLLFAPIWGILSDKYGRKPIIAWGLFGMGITFLIFGTAQSLAVLFIARFLQGGFSAATLPAARAYIADLTTKEERVKMLGRLGAALSLGVILGPAIGGLLAKDSIQLPFFVASVVALLNLVFVLKFLPESIALKTKGVLSFKIVLSQIGQLWKGLRTQLAPLFALAFLWSFALSNNQVAVPLLGLEKFNLGATNIGLIFAVMGAVSGFTQLFLITKITSFIGKHRTIIIGLFLMAFGFMIMPFIPPSIIFLYFAVAISGFGSALSRPVITALISEDAPAGQGATMGTATAFESFGRLIGPIAGGFLFSIGAQVPFLFSGIVVSATLIFIITRFKFLSKST